MSRFVLLAVMAAWSMVGTGALRAGTNVWTSLGPAGGTVTAIAIDPQNSGTVYAVSGARLFKSGNSGASWSALKPGPPCCISTLVMDPQTPSTIYGLSSGKILKSTDGGTNWSPVNSGLPADGGAVRYHFPGDRSSEPRYALCRECSSWRRSIQDTLRKGDGAPNLRTNWVHAGARTTAP